MTINILMVFVTAVITTALTIAAAWYLYHKYVKQMLIDWIDRKADELGEKVRARVKEGVEDGIKSGVAQVGSEVVKKTKEASRKSSGLGMFEESMNTWFRAGKKEPEKPEDE